MVWLSLVAWVVVLMLVLEGENALFRAFGARTRTSLRNVKAAPSGSG